MRVDVEAYNPLWADQFIDIKHDLEKYLNVDQYINIEHIGSTSVVGLAAKPRIDIDIVIRKEYLTAVTEALQKAGYGSLGEVGVPERYAFKAPEKSTISQNLYVCIEGCLSLKNHLAVRDLCRKDADVRDLYGRIKIELSHRDWVDVGAYCEAKNDVLGFILARAGMDQGESVQIRAVNTINTPGADGT